VETRTLGDVLNVSKAKVRVSEKDWVRLVQSIAARDQLALHSLYEQTHRIVFTLIVRITNNRETAEELTLDVFHDVAKSVDLRSCERIRRRLDYESSALQGDRPVAVRTSEKTV
jgi:hypothetical protein